MLPERELIPWGLEEASAHVEELGFQLLIQNTWHGWPDPPEWGLASRSRSDR